MRATTPLIVLATLLIAAYGGCLGGTEKSTASTSSTPSGTDATTGSDGGNDTSNATTTAPVVSVKVLGNGTELSLTNGTYGVLSGVNITLDASGSTDPSGGNLTYAWDLGDNATSTNASVVHAWAAAGNVTVNLTVTSSNNGTANASLPFTVTSSGPVVLRSDKKTFTGTIYVGDQDGVISLPCANSGKDGVDVKSFTWALVDKEADGTKSIANHTILKLTVSGTGGSAARGLDFDLYFLDAAGKTVASAATAAANENLDLQKDLPAGTYTVRVEGCWGVNTTVTVNAEEVYIRA